MYHSHQNWKEKLITKFHDWFKEKVRKINKIFKIVNVGQQENELCFIVFVG